MSGPTLHGQIFVSIAAFRDPETRWTVHDLLKKASNPSRIRIAIVWQIDPEADAHFLDLPCSAQQKMQVINADRSSNALKRLIRHWAGHIEARWWHADQTDHSPGRRGHWPLQGAHAGAETLGGRGVLPADRLAHEIHAWLG